MIAHNVTELIGNTPIVRLNAPSQMSGAEILGKCEFMNPGGSVKDRLGLSLIQTGIASGSINSHTIIIEPTSGNTGIALASICSALGLKLILTMPSSMSIERRKLLKALGAELVLTEPEKGMSGAVAKALELAETTPHAFIPQQFENKANPAIHRQTTALEILRECDNEIDIFVAAVGTGGTLTGVAEVLKQNIPDITIVAVEPQDSPVLSGGNAGPHKIQGIGAGFIPKILNTSIYDEIITVSNDNAFETARNLAKTEGFLVGISAGANVWAATQIAKRPENKGKRIVTILCDTGERYLSTTLFES